MGITNKEESVDTLAAKTSKDAVHDHPSVPIPPHPASDSLRTGFEGDRSAASASSHQQPEGRRYGMHSDRSVVPAAPPTQTAQTPHLSEKEGVTRSGQGALAVPEGQRGSTRS